MVIFAEQKFTEIPVPRICVENATTVPKMKIIMQCNNILMFLQQKWFSVHFLLYFRNRNFRGADFQNFCSGSLKIGSQDGSRWFFPEKSWKLWKNSLLSNFEVLGQSFRKIIIPYVRRFELSLYQGGEYEDIPWCLENKRFWSLKNHDYVDYLGKNSKILT